MATCNRCHADMRSADSCTVRFVWIGPRRAEQARIPYGSERLAFAGDRCHDCGVVRGGFHHPGCLVEQCPNRRHTAYAQIRTCRCAVLGVPKL